MVVETETVGFYRGLCPSTWDPRHTGDRLLVPTSLRQYYNSVDVCSCHPSGRVGRPTFPLGSLSPSVPPPRRVVHGIGTPYVGDDLRSVERPLPRSFFMAVEESEDGRSYGHEGSVILFSRSSGHRSCGPIPSDNFSRRTP